MSRIIKKGRNFLELTFYVAGACDALDRKNEFHFLEESLCTPILEDLK
jgi:hypothetical protein